MKTLSKVYNALIFAFLYAPIVVLIVFSFNSTSSRVKWSGFSLRWYEKLFGNAEILDSLKVTLEIALLSALIATVIGVLSALGIFAMNGKLRKAFLAVNNIPMVNPEIVTGISLMLLFVFIYRSVGLLQPGFTTLLIAHITFNIPYVILQVMPKLRQLDPRLYEAALDLGCPPTRAFCKVVLPEIVPGVLTGALMAFTMSLDDFVISYFNSGSSAQTLSVLIYNMTKKPITPEINALSTLMFGSIMVLLLVINIRQIKEIDTKKIRHRDQ